ncbi:sialate O-acetylesterase [Plebeiibacterium sediminum]|uniref:Sialate O-acetylesterase n=1 Tax=Plebeiibacterium sediminum TaxID=2992112 RepID=A0AAE3M4B2_9BACT|nr:sialate O-acetylesterase [Plebeiobacterium sediminum]MCW3786582.1 sialate O-acetylesterase [Plebeiobacterium sediminum]
MKYYLPYIFILLFFAQYICAEISLPSIISDNMVLQQNMEVKLWGKASVNESVSIKTSWGKSYQTSANNNGKWIVKIKTPKALKNQTIVFEGENKIEIKNVLIGEVWLCSGQSNMEFGVGYMTRHYNGVINYEEEIQKANYPDIHLFKVEKNMSPEEELYDCQGHWEVCTPETIETFSGVGYYFGRKLFQELNTPVGLIESAYGGTHAESWTKRDVMNNDSVYKELLAEFYASKDNYDADLIKYNVLKQEYDKQVEGLSKEELKQFKKPSKPKGINHKKALSTLWNAMINPIVDYSIKGVIWYQGESNSVRHQDYQHVFTKMIESWRTEFEQPDLPFYFVQIAPHYKQPPEIREAQFNTWKTLDHTGMVVITDVGDSTNIHPRNKQVPGERLAAWALSNDYGKKVTYSGPLFKSMKVNDSNVILSFAYTHGGLYCPDKTIRGFTVAAEDGKFYPAYASIKGNKVVLTSNQVHQIKYVRYGWDKYCNVNLFNGAGFPASPFRSDIKH